MSLFELARARGIPVVTRGDVWALLLEPFLDTTFDEEHQAHSLATLASWGLDRARVDEIRRRVRIRMAALTMLTWEWAHYGLHDVLSAMQPLRLSSRFAAFYREAMEIARLGPVSPAGDESLRAFLG